MAPSETWDEVLDRFEGKGQIPLMTIHKSKGMEFYRSSSPGSTARVGGASN